MSDSDDNIDSAAFGDAFGDAFGGEFEDGGIMNTGASDVQEKNMTRDQERWLRSATNDAAKNMIGDNMLDRLHEAAEDQEEKELPKRGKRTRGKRTRGDKQSMGAATMLGLDVAIREVARAPGDKRTEDEVMAEAHARIRGSEIQPLTGPPTWASISTNDPIRFSGIVTFFVFLETLFAEKGIKAHRPDNWPEARPHALDLALPDPSGLQALPNVPAFED